MTRDPFKTRARDVITNKKFVYGSLLLMGGLAVLAYMKDGCWGRKPVQIETAIRGDGRCQEELEGYPYLRDKNGRVMKDDKNQPIKNPNYSKEDCSRNDNVCDTATDPAKLQDPDGKPVTLLGPDGKIATEIIWSKDGKEVKRVKLPLEDESSLDCIKQMVREQPCVQGGAPLTRKRVVLDINGLDLKNLQEQRLRQRTQSEIEDMAAHPETLKQGNNFLMVLDAYQELCDDKLPVCTPEMVSACFCPNHPECIPKKKEEPPPRKEKKKRVPIGRVEQPSEDAPAPVSGLPDCLPQINGLFRDRANRLLKSVKLSQVREAVSAAKGVDAEKIDMDFEVRFTVKNGGATPTSITVHGVPLPPNLVNFSGIPSGDVSCKGKVTGLIGKG